MKYRITVITPVYNGERTLKRCILSVQSQSFACQHVIIDGMSTDRTPAIIDELKREGDIVLRGHDSGIYDAINKGISVSEGEIIAILNSDDYYLHNNVLSLVDKDFDVETDMIYGGTRYFTSGSSKYVDYLPSEYEGKGSFSSDGTRLIHLCEKCYEIGGLFDINLKVAADFDLMFRFLKH